MATVTVLIVMTEIQTVPYIFVVTAVLLCSNKELKGLTKLLPKL
jgi:hypothetical protein